MRKITVLFSFLLAVTLSLHSQVVVTVPAFPTENDSVTLIFDASKGNAGLINYTGDVWAHTGVITNLSTGPTNWKYVIAGWSENTAKAKLKALGNNLWELKIGPSVRAFYNVPANEKILKLAFVFRDATGAKTGRSSDGSDIFADIFEAGLNVSFTKPDKEFLAVDPGASIEVQVSATGADSVALFLDNARITSAPANSLTWSLSAGQSGYHAVSTIAYGKGSTASDQFSYLIKGAGMVAELPAGVKDGINYTSDHSVVLVLYAPQKEFCFLLGDFNNWSVNESYLMKRTPDGLRYWISMDTLEPRKEYQFQYLVDGDIRIADPYADKISDPWNDGYIDSSTYPGLIAYPQGKTTQAVSVMQAGQTPYAWKSTAFTPPANNKLVIYELLLRDFLGAHSFKALNDTLDYLKNLGINAIELMPVNEFEGNSSWGYNPSFYFAVDKYYGPKDTFKAFVDAAHQKGMAVIIDMVLNHCFGQSPLVRLYWDAQNNRPAANNPWFNVQSPNPVYSWGYDFNHESADTKRFVDSVNTYWLNEYRVDGFRFDFSKGFTNTPGDGGSYDASRIAILKRMTDKIWLTKPGAIVILEHFAPNSEEKILSDYGMMLWGNINYSYRQAASAWYSGGSWDFSSVSWKQRGWNQPNLVSYMESHDEERLMYECITYGNTQNPAYNIKSLPLALKRMELAANFFIPVPGPKMVWMFGELGYDYSINYNSRVGEKPIRWDYQSDPGRKRLYQVYSKLNNLKTTLEMFSTSDFSLSLQDTVKRISLNHNTMKATILGNFGIRASWTNPSFQHAGWWYEYWTGDSVEISDINGRLNLKPGEYRLYTDVKLQKPDIISSVDDPADLSFEEVEIFVYPNPASEKIHVNLRGFAPGSIGLRILDLQGRQVSSERQYSTAGDGVISVDINNLESGIYLLELRGERQTRVTRWIKY